MDQCQTVLRDPGSVLPTEQNSDAYTKHEADVVMTSPISVPRRSFAWFTAPLVPAVSVAYKFQLRS